MRIASVSRIDRRSASSMRRRIGDKIAAETAPEIDLADGAGMAVVPLAPPMRETRVAMMTTRPDASFVTHLIAMAEQSPQTRVLRRAAASDVDAMYRAANQNKATAPVGAMTQRSA